MSASSFERFSSWSSRASSALAGSSARSRPSTVSRTIVCGGATPGGSRGAGLAHRHHLRRKRMAKGARGKRKEKKTMSNSGSLLYQSSRKTSLVVEGEYHQGSHSRLHTARSHSFRHRNNQYPGVPATQAPFTTRIIICHVSRRHPHKISAFVRSDACLRKDVLPIAEADRKGRR